MTNRPVNRRISVVTPTLCRPEEIRELLDNLAVQTVLPFEIVIVDGAPDAERHTEAVVLSKMAKMPYAVNYIRRGGGTAIQRNIGIDAAHGDFIAFIDDDVRLSPRYFEILLEAFASDPEGRVGGIAGYITNQFLDPKMSPRWRWYRALRLFSTYEPGRYDYQTGYPINRYTQPPHDTCREIDFMGANCALWRRQVFESGLRFSDFFRDYGVLEDAHLALRARRKWTLWECGRAHCLHFHSPRGRINTRRLAQKSAINYRFVFVDIVPQRTLAQELRFWRVQGFDLFRIVARAFRTWTKQDWSTALGKIEGIVAATRVRPGQTA